VLRPAVKLPVQTQSNLPCLRRTQVCLCNAHCLLDSSVTRQHLKSDQLSVTREMESSRCPSAGASNPDWRIWNPILITIFQVLLSSAPDRLLPCQGFRAQAFRFQPNAWNLEGLDSCCPLPLLLNLETSRVFPNFIASSTCGGVNSRWERNRRLSSRTENLRSDHWPGQSHQALQYFQLEEPFQAGLR
jgi:hypothetical protein